MTRLAPLAALAAIAGLAGWSAAEEGETLRFEGNQSFGRAELIRALRRYSVEPQGQFGRTEADDAAYFLREFYFSQGFPDADVGYDFRPAPPSVVFRIREGGVEWVDRVLVGGAEAITPERVRDIFDAAVRQAALRPFGRLRFVESALEQGRQAVARAFANEGFLDAEVELATLPRGPGMVDLSVEIRQGTQYRLERVEVSGAGPLEDEIRALFGAQIDQPYLLNEENAFRLRAAEFLRNNGYFRAEATSSAYRDRASGRVTVNLDLTPGKIYRIGEIRVSGNDQTGAGAVLRRFAIRPGALYDRSALDEGARRLWFSGAFAEAEVKPMAAGDGVVDLDLELVESRAKQVRFNLGYSEWEQIFGEIHYVDRNFLGTLNRFSVDAFLSLRGYGASATLASPWMFGIDATGSVGVFFSQRELPAYRSREYGVPLGFERRFDSTTLTNYRFRYVWKRVDGEAFGEDFELADPDYTFGGLTFGQTYDTRNDILSPMQGWFLDHEAEIASPALLGDLSFVRLEGQITKYFPLRKITPERPFIPFIVLNHRAGILLPFGETTVVPVQERFYLGGPNTVRSYQLDGLGPRDQDGVPLGGLAMLQANAEIQWPVFKNIYFAAFVDAGNLAPVAEELQLSDTQVGVGPGLRVYTPIGAVRVDYGYNVNRGAGDPVGAWQFGFGFTF